jgi:flavin-dependent dehydrogenase
MAASLRHFDVIVLGAGPAGSVLGQQLCRKGYSVAIVEKEKCPRYAIGETLPASVNLLLSRAQVVRPDTMVPGSRTTGNLSAWGSSRLRFQPHSDHGSVSGFQVLRSAFDNQLLTAARNAGATLFEECSPAELHHENPGWTVVLRHKQLTGEKLTTRFLCDATGRSRLVARHLQLAQTVHGRLLGLVGYWSVVDPQDEADGFNTLVESLPDGWFYTARLDSSQRVAGFMTDRALLPSNLRRNAGNLYRRALSRTRHVKRRLRGCELNSEIHIFPAYPSLVDPCSGRDWILVGDAASTLDPLCSQGVQKAIASALTGCTAVHTLLSYPERDGSVLEFCRERERTGFQSHLSALGGYYSRERRYAQKPFWKQRATARTTTPAGVDQAAPVLQLAREKLTLGDQARVIECPVIDGEYVEVRSAVSAPRAERGIRFCGEVCVPDVVELLAGQGATISDLLCRYRRLHRGISAAAFTRGIASLLQLNVLQRATPKQFPSGANDTTATMMPQK